MSVDEIPANIQKDVEFQYLICRYGMSHWKLSQPDIPIDDIESIRSNTINHGKNLIDYGKGIRNGKPSENPDLNIIEKCFNNNPKQFIKACVTFFQEFVKKQHKYDSEGNIIESFHDRWLKAEEAKFEKYINADHHLDHEDTNKENAKITFFVRDQLQQRYPTGIPSQLRASKMG